MLSIILLTVDLDENSKFKFEKIYYKYRDVLFGLSLKLLSNRADSEVLYLHYVRDLSVKQTAHLLERKSETVKMQLVRGKRILTEMLLEVANE